MPYPQPVPGAAVPYAVPVYQQQYGFPTYGDGEPQPVPPPQPVTSGGWGSGMSAVDANAAANFSMLCCCLALKCCVPNEYTENSSLAGAQSSSHERGGYGSYSSGEQHSCCGVICEDNAKCGCCPPHCSGGCGCQCGNGAQKCDCDCCSQLSKCCSALGECCKGMNLGKCVGGLGEVAKGVCECLGAVLSACPH